MTNYVVDAGQTLSNVAIAEGDSLKVNAQGLADAVTVSGGLADIYAEGTGTNLTLSGGFTDVRSGGLVTDTLVDGGFLTADSGAQIGSITVASGFAIASGGTIAGVTVTGSGGYAQATSGGLLTDVTATSGFIEAMGGTVDGATLSGAPGDGTDLIVGSFSNTGTVQHALIETGASVVLGPGIISDSTIDGGSVGDNGPPVSVTSTLDNVTLLSGEIDLIQGEQLIGNQIRGGTMDAKGGVDSGTTLFGGFYSATLEIIDNPVLDGGQLLLDQGTLDGSVMFGGAGTLSLQTTDVTSGATIDGFGIGDEIWLRDFGGGGYTAQFSADHVLTVAGNDGTATLRFDPTQDFSGLYFHVGQSIYGEVVYVDGTPCYCRGTRILTERGEIEVEALAIGDCVITASGAAKPIQWIGRRGYNGRFVAKNPDVMPIRFKAGSIAEGVPHRDLFVSPNHAMFMDGVLIPAKQLVNGVSVVQVEQVESVAYFHVELDAHDLLVAEGALAESFVDCDSRGMFHNAGEFGALYPEGEAPRWAFCAERVESGEKLERVRLALAERAGIAVAAWGGVLRGQVDHVQGGVVAGWAAQDGPGAVALDVVVDGAVIGAVIANEHRADLAVLGMGGAHGFRFVLPRLDADRAHIVALRRPGDGAELPGSPVLVPTRTLPGALQAVDPGFLAGALERLRVARPERAATA